MKTLCVKLDKRLSGGIAGVAAMANIPHNQMIGQYSVGFGVGYFNGQSAAAIGGSYKFSENVTAQASFSANTGSSFKPVVGTGVAFSF